MDEGVALPGESFEDLPGPGNTSNQKKGKGKGKAKRKASSAGLPLGPPQSRRKASEHATAAGAATPKSPAPSVSMGGLGSFGSKEAKTAETLEKHKTKVEVMKVLSGETSKADIFQAKRAATAFQNKGNVEEATILDARVQAANAALMIQSDAAKLPWDQVEAAGY